MRGRWWRWRGYMDELEEAMRMCGQHLEESERLIARQYERETWRGRKRDGVEDEWVRRALDVPFLERLVRHAARLGDLAALRAPDFSGRAWREEEQQSTQPSVERGADAAFTAGARPEGEAAPARLRAAERALAQRTRSLTVVLDQLVSPRNVSAVIRSADAFGLQELHVIQGDGKVKLERTVTNLSHRWLDLFWHRDVETAVATLRKRGYRILAADFHERATSVEEVPLGDKIALAFGSEQRGVSEALAQAADGFFYLPTTGFTAYLNVSVAAAVALYSVDRRLREAGLRRPLDEAEKAELRPAWYKALARGNPGRAWRYLAWVERPPAPAAAGDRLPMRDGG